MLPSIANASNLKFVLFLSLLPVVLHHPLHEGLCPFVGNVQGKTSCWLIHTWGTIGVLSVSLFACFSCVVTRMWLFVFPLFLKNINLDTRGFSSIFHPLVHHHAAAKVLWKTRVHTKQFRKSYWVQCPQSFVLKYIQIIMKPNNKSFNFYKLDQFSLNFLFWTTRSRKVLLKTRLDKHDSM